MIFVDHIRILLAAVVHSADHQLSQSPEIITQGMRAFQQRYVHAQHMGFGALVEDNRLPPDVLPRDTYHSLENLVGAIRTFSEGRIPSYIGLRSNARQILDKTCGVNALTMLFYPGLEVRNNHAADELAKRHEDGYRDAINNAATILTDVARESSEYVAEHGAYAYRPDIILSAAQHAANAAQAIQQHARLGQNHLTAHELFATAADILNTHAHGKLR